MLVTDVSWSEYHPVRRALVKPFQPWRCVGWTDETPNFLAFVSRTRHGSDLQPDGMLISGLEALLEIASQWEPGSFTVYALDRSESDSATSLSRVTGIWRERDATLEKGPWLWYSTNHGEMKPCAQIRLHVENRSELINELNLDLGDQGRPTVA